MNVAAIKGYENVYYVAISEVQAQQPYWIAQWNNFPLLLCNNQFMNQSQEFCPLNGAFVRTDNCSLFEPKHIVDRIFKCVFIYVTNTNKQFTEI